MDHPVNEHSALENHSTVNTSNIKIELGYII